MRIVHVCQPTDGGSAAVVLSLAEAGVAAGDDVTVVCPTGDFLGERAAAAGAHWVVLELHRSPQLKDLLYAARLRSLVRGADVLHLHSSKAGAVGRLAAAACRRRPRVIFTPHGWSWYVGGRAAHVYRIFERLAAKVTTVVTVVSAQEVADGRSVLGASAPIELIENGVDTTDFSPEGRHAQRRVEPLLVQVGRLSTQKGQDRSLRALSALADQSVRLRLIGDGPLRQELVELSDHLDIAHRVEFMGTTDPRPHLRAADLVLLPSRWEGMSLALLEAMSSGATVIASACGGTDALGDAGVLVGNGHDEGVVEELTSQVEILLADQALRTTLGRAARGRAVAHYDVTKALSHYERVWRGVETLTSEQLDEAAA